MSAQPIADPFNLERFARAQEPMYAEALSEIRHGRKQSHWMWFIFPQVSGLGKSVMARAFAIRSLEEASAYLAHSSLGPRYLECVSALQHGGHVSAREIFGDIDATKLRSSLTLFEAAGADHIVSEALDRWFGGMRDSTTLSLIRRSFCAEND